MVRPHVARRVRLAQTDLLCMQSPSVQFLDCKTSPSQSLPPFLGAGAVHSRLRQCVHSVPQVDHLLQEVHRPSTATEKKQYQATWTRRLLRHRELSASIKTNPAGENGPSRSTAFISTAGSGACSVYIHWAQRTLLTGCVTVYSLTEQGSLEGHTEAKLSPTAT